MNRRTAPRGGRREGRRTAAVPADRRVDRELDRRRQPGRGHAGALHQRARGLPPDQPGDRGQGHQPARRGRDPLQETRHRHVRRDGRPRAAAGAAAPGLHAAVPRPADGGGGQARHGRRGHQEADRRLGAAAMNVVRTTGVTKRYGPLAALDGVSVALAGNTIHGLLGRNGAGKTTLMRILTGQAFATGGAVEVFGQHPYENADVLSRVCFIKESQHYPEKFRVKHALRAAALLYPEWDAAYAAALLAAFAVPAGSRIGRLSRGQLSAVGGIIGLASRASLTLFDEPYLGLDAVARQLFYDRLLADFAEHPRTVVLSTHLIEEIAGLLERVLLIDRGTVLLDADAESLRGSALTVTGPRAAVDAFAARHELLHSESLGGHSRAVVRLSDATDGTDAAAARLSREPPKLHQLVVALSLHPPPPAATDDLEEVSR